VTALAARSSPCARGVSSHGRRRTVETADSDGSQGGGCVSEPTAAGLSILSGNDVMEGYMFDRGTAFGMRLCVPAGTAVGFEPGR
jgi:Urease beta subunit